MGYVPSTSKTTLEAYLTQKGRMYLIFSGTTEDVTIKYFALGDPDTNYIIASNNSTNGDKNVLPSGFVSDLSGDHSCIKSMAIEKQRYFIGNPDNDNNLTFNNI